MVWVENGPPKGSSNQNGIIQELLLNNIFNLIIIWMELSFARFPSSLLFYEIILPVSF